MKARLDGQMYTLKLLDNVLLPTICALHMVTFISCFELPAEARKKWQGRNGLALEYLYNIRIIECVTFPLN